MTANATQEILESGSDRRLWTAVLLQALEDWGSTNKRVHTSAEEFLFQSEGDFVTVCRGAGLEPSSVLARLQKMKKIAPRPQMFQLPLVA
jgi:hypothetical protein